MTDVRAFVESYLEAIRADAKRLPTGALAVRWPPTHVGEFGPSTTLAFNPAVAEVANGELCVLGSDILDRILADASGRGFHCVARVDAANEPPADDVLAANLTFRNATPSILAADHGLVPYVLFNFRVTLETDEKREFLHPVLLNAETHQEHQAADIFLQESLTLPEEPIVSGEDLAAAYRAACSALETAIRPEVEEVRAKAAALLDEELRRIESFYEVSIQELYAGRGPAPLEAERVFRAEEDRRVDEVRRKHALTASVRLVNARTILLPTTTMRVRVANARAAKEASFEYDAVNLETNLPGCESCGAATDIVYLCARGHLACDVCDRGCSLCDFVACATCAPTAIASCVTCVRPLCTDHAFLDGIGRRTYCGDHIHTCAICGRNVGPAYVRACALCAQSYCAICVAEGTGRCTTCANLAAVAETHEDVTRMSMAKGIPKGVRWWRGENGRCTVLVAKGTVFQQVFVLDRDGNVVHRRKGVGLLDG